MTTTRTKATLALACFAGLSAAFAAEYVGPDVPSVSTGEPIPTPTDNLRSIPRNAYETRPAVGLPVQSIFRNTRAPYYDNLRDVKLDPEALHKHRSRSASTSLLLPSPLSIAAPRDAYVFPHGAQVRTRWGFWLKPLSSIKTTMRSSFSAFLKARPSLLLPVPDGWLVALDGAGRGTLATPTHLPQQPTDVVGRLSDAEFGPG